MKTGLVLAIVCVLALGGPGVSTGLADCPPDPGENGPNWMYDLACGTSDVEAVECAFNAAREWENAQLGLSLPEIDLPDQVQWDALSDSEKGLWLINLERVDRGVHPLHGVEANVNAVAQTYAQLLLDTDTFGHDEDDSPWERLNANPTIGACHDYLSVAENLYVSVAYGSIPLPVEQAIHGWLYDDADSNWGHRHAILWYPYNDNSGDAGKEGFLGIGLARGGPYTGPFSSQWPEAALVVMNVFDPCAAWIYDTPPEPVVTTGQASGLQVSPMGALAAVMLNGEIDPNGTATNGFFEIWPLDAPAEIQTTAIQPIGNGETAVPVQAQIAGLSMAREYGFWMVADNGFGAYRAAAQYLDIQTGYVDPLPDGDCSQLTPCFSGHIQPAVDASAALSLIKVAQGDFLEDTKTNNLVIDQDVVLIVGYNDDYSALSPFPTRISPGNHQAATVTVQKGTFIPCGVIIQ